MIAEPERASIRPRRSVACQRRRPIRSHRSLTSHTGASLARPRFETVDLAES
jgi:hypothetical protein